jgi:hypothetical protein
VTARPESSEAWNLTPIDSGRAVGITLLVGSEEEAEAFGESDHFGHGDHDGARAAEHDDMSVVDHDLDWDAAEVAASFGQQNLALEAPKPGIGLEEKHSGVGEYRSGAVDGAMAAVDANRVGRGVMLHLLAGLKVVMAGRGLGLGAGR